MFGITGPSDEHRREPVLGRGIASPGQEFATSLVSDRPSILLSAGGPQRAAADGLPGIRTVLNAIKKISPAAERARVSRSTHERDAALRWEDAGGTPPSRDVFDRPRAVDAGWWERLRGPLGSLLVHLLPLLLLIDWPTMRSTETEPVPVELVLVPPPAKPAPPQPQPKPVQPPPRGPLASDDLGEPEAKETDRPKSDAPTSAGSLPKNDTPPVAAKPVEKPPQTAAVEPWPLPPAKPDAPHPDAVAKPPPKPNPSAHQTPRRVEEPANLAPRRARYPGPAATQDEYFAYMKSLIRQHFGLLPEALLGQRRGRVVIAFVVRDDGTIMRISVGDSSGYPDIDNRVAEMVAAVGRFPPLPQWFQGPEMLIEFHFPFPEGLRE